MSSEKPPSSFPSPIYEPEVWQENMGPITPENILSYAVSFPTPQNTQITFPNDVRLVKPILASDNSTKASTTAFVKTAVDNLKTGVNTISGIMNFTGNSTCAFQSSDTNDATLANTDFVNSAVSNLLASSPTFLDTVTMDILKATTLLTDTIKTENNLFPLLSYSAATDTITMGKPTVMPNNSTGITQTATDNSTKLSTTAFVQNNLDVLKVSPTFTGTTTITTLNPTNLSQMPIITAPKTVVFQSGALSTKIGSLFNSGFVNFTYVGGTNLVYYAIPEPVPPGVYMAVVYYSTPNGTGFFRILFEGKSTPQTAGQPVTGGGDTILHIANTSGGSDVTETDASQAIEVSAPNNYLYVRAVTGATRDGAKFIRVSLLRMG